MKTRLLLFMTLFSCAVSFSQFDIAESYETQFPTGWVTSGATTGFSRVLNQPYACDGSYVMQADLSGTNNFAQIITSDYISSGTPITASFKYNAFYNQSNPAVGTVYFYYSVNDGAYGLLSSRTTFGNCSGNVLQATIPAASVPAGSLVKFRMQINSTNSTIFFDDFRANQAPVTPIAEYNFDNTYNDINDSTPFNSNAGGTSFVDDRNGNASSALSIIDTGVYATIPNLPYGNAARTVSIWAKLNNFNSAGFNFLFHYGSSSNGNGAIFNATTVTQFTSTPSHVVSETNALDTWYHFVFVYDGTNSKIYKNGVLLISTARTWSTVNNPTNPNQFKLGLTDSGNQGYFNGVLDDLKIYGSALSDAQVLSLFTNNTLLSSQNFNQNNLEVSLYPNPTNDILNIETALEIQSVEIYNIQGQKVKSANQKQINVSNLANGMYMIRIQDTENAVSTKKFMKQ